MKYVRTKDRIYEFVDYDEARYRANILGFYWPEIVKEADTIEELCDVFFIENNADKLPTSCLIFEEAQLKIGRLKEFVNEEKEGLCKFLYEKNPDYQFEGNVYGAIYIKGKGFIYVAKMNKEGKLELL